MEAPESAGVNRKTNARQRSCEQATGRVESFNQSLSFDPKEVA